MNLDCPWMYVMTDETVAIRTLKNTAEIMKTENAVSATVFQGTALFKGK